MKNIQEIASALPEYAKDTKINLQSIINHENQNLSAKQVFGSALASAYATKNKSLIEAIENEAKEVLSEAEIRGAKIATSLMAMNNIYYRFLHLVEDEQYMKLPAGLRMKGIADNGIEKIDFEIMSLAVSVINGCGMCIVAHTKQLEKHGFSKTQVQEVAKISAVINAVSQSLALN